MWLDREKKRTATLDGWKHVQAQASAQRALEEEDTHLLQEHSQEATVITPATVQHPNSKI